MKSGWGILDTIADLGILPVLTINDETVADPLADALIEGGIPAIEITLRTPAALNTIRKIRQCHPEMTICAGTVLTCAQVENAVAAGADCIVTPGYSREVVDYCRKRALAVVPGCVTAAEIQAGCEVGLKTFKFFPAENSGGVATLKAFHGPFSDCMFLPTGGMNLDNIGSYLDQPYVAACGGSFMAPAAAIAARDWAQISASCRRALDIALGFTLAHVGMNHEDEASALQHARQLGELFRMPVQPGNSSIFVGRAVECMKNPGAGKFGHIGFATRSARRALAYCRAHGIAVREDGIRYDVQGEIQSFYLREEVGGFALHFVRQN